MKRLSLIALILLLGAWTLAASSMAFAEGEDEGSMFGGDDTVVSGDQVVNDNADADIKKQGLGVSGIIDASSTYLNYSAADDWTGLGDPDRNLSSLIYSDIFFDLRFRDGMKSFLSMEASYNPSPVDPAADKADLALKEFFIDTNINNKVYFRLGKQVLTWGRSYFWNPTDMVNVERKNFFDMDREREGTYGLKVHIPSGVKRNIYLFLDMENGRNTDELSLAGQYEILVGETEMSFSAWLKKGYKPVLGYDFTGNISDMTVRGEVSFTNGVNNSQIVGYDNATYQFIVDQKKGWVPRASLGFTKTFDLGDIKNRISLTGEFYYNGAGYDDDIFQQITDMGGNKMQYLGGYYQPYMNSKYYMALFCSVQRFIITDMALNVNSIANLVDGSFTLSTGVVYHPALKDISYRATINGFFGDQFSEATFSGNKYTLTLGLQGTF